MPQLTESFEKQKSKSPKTPCASKKRSASPIAAFPSKKMRLEIGGTPEKPVTVLAE